jgi:hypothetical protein
VDHIKGNNTIDTIIDRYHSIGHDYAMSIKIQEEEKEIDAFANSKGISLNL